jgi:hypothetical protein
MATGYRQPDDPAAFRHRQRPPPAKLPGELEVVLGRTPRRHDHERARCASQIEADPVGELVILGKRRLVGVDPRQQRPGGALLTPRRGERGGRRRLLEVDARHTVDVFEQEVRAVEQRRALCVGGRVEQRTPCEPRRAPEVRRDHVAGNPLGGAIARMRPERLEL